MHIATGGRTTALWQREHSFGFIMTRSEAAGMHGPASGCGGHGEPTAVGAETTVGVKTTVGAPVDSVIAFGWHSFINPVILGRQMSPVVLGDPTTWLA